MNLVVGHTPDRAVLLGALAGSAICMLVGVISFLDIVHRHGSVMGDIFVAGFGFLSLLYGLFVVIVVGLHWAR